MSNNSPSFLTCRTRSLSMASESQRIRDALINPPSNTTTPFIPVSSSSSSKYDRSKKHLSHDTPRSLFGDYDHLPSSLPLPPLPDPATLTPEQKKHIKRQKEQQKEHLHFSLQQKDSKKLDRQAKLEQKQKKAEYQQMYQNQHDYIHAVDSRKAEKRQQLSLPIYPAGQWDPLPTAELYYHESRHYRQPKTTSINSQHHNSFSSSSSTMTSSPQTKHSSHEKPRSMSLKSTTKSMYDLRPWSGTPQSPTFDYISYDSDDTAGTHGWDSLMDTLYSPSTESPNSWSNSSLDVPYVATSGSKDTDPDLDLVETALSTMALSTDKLGNGNGKYLLGKLSDHNKKKVHSLCPSISPHRLFSFLFFSSFFFFFFFIFPFYYFFLYRRVYVRVVCAHSCLSSRECMSVCRPT